VQDHSPHIDSQIEFLHRRFGLRIVLIRIEGGELVDRIGVQPLGFDPGITLVIRVVGM
jgi:hypothetical protein